MNIKIYVVVEMSCTDSIPSTRVFNSKEDAIDHQASIVDLYEKSGNYIDNTRGGDMYFKNGGFILLHSH